MMNKCKYCSGEGLLHLTRQDLFLYSCYVICIDCGKRTETMWDKSKRVVIKSAEHEWDKGFIS